MGFPNWFIFVYASVNNYVCEEYAFKIPDLIFINPWKEIQPSSLSSSLTSLQLKQHVALKSFLLEFWFASAPEISLFETLFLSCLLGHEKLLRTRIKFSDKGLLPLLFQWSLIAVGLRFDIIMTYFMIDLFGNKNILKLCWLEIYCHLGCLFLRQWKNLKLFSCPFCCL